MSTFNYRYLYYFWVVAKEGGMTRAADRLGMAVQTVSVQVRELERALGHTLLKPSGHGLVLTEAGVAATHPADLIFQLGEKLPAAAQEAVSAPSVRLGVGISDGLPKLVVRRLLEPMMAEPNLRLLCHDGEFDDLLGELPRTVSTSPLPTAPRSRMPTLSFTRTPWAPARSPGTARQPCLTRRTLVFRSQWAVCPCCSLPATPQYAPALTTG